MEDFVSWLVAVVVLAVVAVVMPVSLAAAEPTVTTTWTRLAFVKTIEQDGQRGELERYDRIKPADWVQQHAHDVIPVLMPWNGAFDDMFEPRAKGKPVEDDIIFEAPDVRVELSRGVGAGLGAFRLSPAFGPEPMYVVWLPVNRFRWRSHDVFVTLFVGFVRHVGGHWRLERLFVPVVDDGFQKVVVEGLSEEPFGGRPVVRLSYCVPGHVSNGNWWTHFEATFEYGQDGVVREIWKGETGLETDGRYEPWPLRMTDGTGRRNPGPTVVVEADGTPG